MVRDRSEERLLGILKGKKQAKEGEGDKNWRDHGPDHGFF